MAIYGRLGRLICGALLLIALGLLINWRLILSSPTILATHDAGTILVSSPVTTTYRVYMPTFASEPAPTTPSIGIVTPLSTTVGRYEKMEVAFQLATVADNVYLPYDLTPLMGQWGVSVDMLLTDPSGVDKTTPCFYYQPVDNNLLPVGPADWRCRFAPDVIGVWQYHVRAIDRSGSAESATSQFNVTPSASHGFVQVSPTDHRYFDYSDGTPFAAPLVNVEVGNHLNGLDKIRTTIPLWGQNGVRFVRWFPTGESANYYNIPYSDNLYSSWGFGSAGMSTEGDPAIGQMFTFKPYYYSGQTIAAMPGARYRLSLRAKVTGSKVFRPQLGDAVLEIRASDWHDYTIETVSQHNYLEVWLHDGYSENDNTSGTIRVYAMRLQRDETGHDDWGPNLLTRGDPDTDEYIDQIGAARLDEIMRLSEQYGVYHKLTLFHKNDDVLGQTGPDGVLAPWSVDNFYSGPGQVVNRFEKAYARYFVARWSYSTALHSLELANENMLTQNSYDAAFDVLGYVRSIEPRHILLSNSFWGYFVTEFWAGPRGSLLDYADKHWYARASSTDPELVSLVAFDSAANVRECQRAFANYATWYHVNKPIVRGETGVWQPGTVDPLDLGTGAATYYHKQLWAQMGDQCDGEWYTAFLRDQNLWSDYGRYERFLQDEPINNGRYTDIGTDVNSITVTNQSGSVRAWGKLDATVGRGFAWIDNANDTWKHVADGAAIAPAGGTLTIGGLPNGTYTINWFNTSTGAVVTSTQTVANGGLALMVTNLQHDTAVKIKRQ